MKRKLLSLAMIAALCLTMLPTAGWAADETIDDWQEPTPPADVSRSWIDTNNYDISWYDADGTDFELENVADLAGLAMLSSGNLTVGDCNEANIDLGDDYNPYREDDKVYLKFDGKTVSLKAEQTYNLSGKEWMPIQSFQGTFDGKMRRSQACRLALMMEDRQSLLVCSLMG